ncbi:MAG: SIS domain-containing protein, partial [Halothiobacillaceae bacterium]
MSLAASQVHSHLEVVRALEVLVTPIEVIGEVAVGALRRGGCIFLCGNGGSAADAQHIAAELVGRFAHARRGLPAVALTTDTSALT